MKTIIIYALLIVSCISCETNTHKEEQKTIIHGNDTTIIRGDTSQIKVKPGANTDTIQVGNIQVISTRVKSTKQTKHENRN